MFQLNSLCIVLGREEDDEDSAAPQTRTRLPKEATEYLVNWFLDNIDHPHPTPEQKKEMMRVTGQTRRQLDQWFENHRRPERKKQLVLVRAARGSSMDSGIPSGASTADSSSPLRSLSAPPNFQGDPTAFPSTSQGLPQLPGHTSSESDATETDSDTLVASEFDTDDEYPPESQFPAFDSSRAPPSKRARHTSEFSEAEEVIHGVESPTSGTSAVGSSRLIPCCDGCDTTGIPRWNEINEPLRQRNANDNDREEPILQEGPSPSTDNIVDNVPTQSSISVAGRAASMPSVGESSNQPRGVHQGTSPSRDLILGEHSYEAAAVSSSNLTVVSLIPGIQNMCNDDENKQ